MNKNKIIKQFLTLVLCVSSLFAIGQKKATIVLEKVDIADENCFSTTKDFGRSTTCTYSTKCVDSLDGRDSGTVIEPKPKPDFTNIDDILEDLENPTSPLDPTGCSEIYGEFINQIVKDMASYRKQLSWRYPGCKIKAKLHVYEITKKTIYIGRTFTDSELPFSPDICEDHFRTTYTAKIEYRYTICCPDKTKPKVKQQTPPLRRNSSTAKNENSKASETTLAVSEWNLYPNPAKNQVHIKSYNPKLNLEVKIFNANGAEVLSNEYSEKGIDISGLANGIYYVSFQGKKVRLAKLQ